ncbi:Erp3p [Saccharomyces eubayanus]|uniref:Erp3p n=1 Tax=Saccharomyces eubayanus TaxID=1080349 RepID=UPI0006C2AA9E|nr:ERP3-like protein [Saccharomyces eubayanus]KOH00334.1 ERP3-like protein [Saccharomyces eubayanus]
MSSLCVFLFHLLFLTQFFAKASPLTFQLKKGQKECLYTLTPDIDCSISYYFAVQQGESNDFDVNYEIYAPDDKNKPIIERSGERQGEWSFVGQHKGEYSFCFYGGKAHDKIVDLDIKYTCERQDDVRNERRKVRKAQRNLRDSKIDPLQDTLENSIDTIERQLHVLERNVQHYKTRNTRNHHTVCSTERRIVMFSIYGILLIIGMSCAQIAALEFIFRESRKHNV